LKRCELTNPKNSPNLIEGLFFKSYSNLNELIRDQLFDLKTKETTFDQEKSNANDYDMNYQSKTHSNLNNSELIENNQMLDLNSLHDYNEFQTQFTNNISFEDLNKIIDLESDLVDQSINENKIELDSQNYVNFNDSLI
jgi:hypothetical protein